MRKAAAAAPARCSPLGHRRCRIADILGNMKKESHEGQYYNTTFIVSQSIEQKATHNNVIFLHNGIAMIRLVCSKEWNINLFCVDSFQNSHKKNLQS